MNDARAEVRATPEAADPLREAGIRPWGSPEVARFEVRLERAITRVYHDARRSPKRLEELGVSSRQGAVSEETQSLLEKHYDARLELFQRFLDSDFLAYSMAYYGETPEQARTSERTLEEAQHQKFALVCERAQVRGDERVLNIGCGFGSLETYLLQEYPEIQVVGITPSRVQASYLRARMADPRDVLGQGRFALHEGKLETIPTPELGIRSFDLVVSIGVLEHVKNLHAAFGRMRALLRPAGRAFHHLITSREVIPSFLDARQTQIHTYFPGGRIWPFAELEAQTDLFRLEGSWFVNGMNYWRTLDAWHRRFWESIDRLYPSVLGKEGVRHWNDYFALCKAVFAAMDGEMVGNGQYLFRSQG